MDEIIIRSMQGTATPAEEESLRGWRQESLQHERHYREMARAWRAAGLIEPVSTPLSRLPVRTARDRGGVPLLARLEQSRPFARRLGWAAAIAALLAIGVGIGVSWRSAEPRALLAEEFTTGRGEMVTTRLNDGTVVRLASESRLRVTGSVQRREVWLDGHAFFAVAREESRAFVVRTRAGEAIVLGTRFDVRVEGDRMQVFVVEGRVAHHAGGETVQVGAMELSRAADGERPAVQTIEDPQPLLSWLGEFLVFQSTPIREVAHELERRFGVQVRVADGAVAERTVTAWFTDERLADVLLIICRAADARCVVRDSTVTIEP